jgi:hypothetical protein
MAWIYEHDLKKPDSAIAQYKTLALKFGKTVYGAAAVRRIPPPPEPPVPDSTKTKTGEVLKGPPRAGSAAAGADSTLKSVGTPTAKAGADTTLTSSARPKIVPDTTGLNSLLKKAPPDSTKKVFDIDEVERKPMPRDTTRSRRVKESEEK